MEKNCQKFTCLFKNSVMTTTWNWFSLLEYGIWVLVAIGLVIYKKLTPKILELPSSGRIQRFRSQNIRDHQKVLRMLHKSSANCNNVYNAMRCVDLTSAFPGLINVPLIHDSKGLTPFLRVCSQANTVLVEFMLAKGADLNLTTSWGETPLHLTTKYFLHNKEKSDLLCLNLLYKKGCRFPVNDHQYSTILRRATKSGNKNLTRWLFYHPPAKVLKETLNRSMSSLL